MELYKVSIKKNSGYQSYFIDDREELDKFLNKQTGKIFAIHKLDNNTWKELKKDK